MNQCYVEAFVDPCQYNFFLSWLYNNNLWLYYLDDRSLYFCHSLVKTFFLYFLYNKIFITNLMIHHRTAIILKQYIIAIRQRLWWISYEIDSRRSKYNSDPLTLSQLILNKISYLNDPLAKNPTCYESITLS